MKILMINDTLKLLREIEESIDYAVVNFEVATDAPHIVEIQEVCDDTRLKLKSSIITTQDVANINVSLTAILKLIKY